MTSKGPLVKSRSEGCEGNASEPSELLIGLGSALCLVVCEEECLVLLALLVLRCYMFPAPLVAGARGTARRLW